MENQDELSVALIQTDLYWENVIANLSSLEEKIALLASPMDVIVLPEMFNTGFTMNTGVAEHANLTTTRWMKQVAAQTKALLIGSFSVKEGKHFYNRLHCVYPDGSIAFSDKRHLFRMGQEHQTYTSGTARIMVDWKGWKICPLICYDLRFPVWSRNISSDPYDLLIYVANWPARRANAWNALLKARAIENQCYVAGVNRVGADGDGTAHQGDSVMLDYLGDAQTDMGAAEGEKIVPIRKSDLMGYRQSFPAFMDADDFEIRNH